ncbi:MAG: TolC family outer membrane protein [Rubrivivax sp.]
MPARPPRRPHRRAPRLQRPLRPALLALAAACALVAPGAARAQSLQDLYEAARSYDATYLAARALAQSAEYRMAQSEALQRPSVAATAAGTTARVDPPTVGWLSSNTTQGALNGRYPLFNRGNDASVAQARKAYEAAQADLDGAEQDLIVRLAQAYFDVLAAKDSLAATRANKTAITEQLASAKRNFEVGTATITDTREAQAKYDLVVAQEIFAENDLRAKRVALDQLVGRANVDPRPLAVPVVLPALVPGSVEEWVTAAEGQHPSIRKARLGVDTARLETEKARAGRLPTVDAVATLALADQRGSAVLPTSRGTTTSGSLGVQLNWPLYSGGAVESRIKETVLLEDKAGSDLQAARRGVAQSTRVAFLGVQSGLAQVKALEAAEASSKLALEATQLGYKVGVRVNVDVLNAQTQLYGTQRDLAKARYDNIVGSLKLRQASGQLNAGDVGAANRLLAP